MRWWHNIKVDANKKVTENVKDKPGSSYVFNTVKGTDIYKSLQKRQWSPNFVLITLIIISPGIYHSQMAL